MIHRFLNLNRQALRSVQRHRVTLLASGQLQKYSITSQEHVLPSYILNKIYIIYNLYFPEVFGDLARPSFSNPKNICYFFKISKLAFKLDYYKKRISLSTRDQLDKNFIIQRRAFLRKSTKVFAFNRFLRNYSLRRFLAQK